MAYGEVIFRYLEQVCTDVNEKHKQCEKKR